MLRINVDVSDVKSLVGLPKKLDLLTKRLMEKVRKAVYDATPEDTGRAKGSWTGVERTSQGYSFGNYAPYAHILQTGSLPGKRPWPSVGPKTEMYEGRIYSSQAPGGIFKKANIEVVIEEAVAELWTQLK